jgi:hypothetical protein
VSQHTIDAFPAEDAGEKVNGFIRAPRKQQLFPWNVKKLSEGVQ